MTKISFVWAFAEPGTASGLPKENAWRCGVIKSTTRVHELHLAFIKLIQEQYKTENVRIRLHFKLGKINSTHNIFQDPSFLDKRRFIECTPEWYTTRVEELIEQVGLSCIISKKIKKRPWSWEHSFRPNENLKMGIIYDVKDTRLNYYQATPVCIGSNTWRFHFINWKSSWDELVSFSCLKERVFSRGSHTKGYHILRDNGHPWLYPPYPKQTVADNEDIKLGLYYGNSIAKIIDDIIPTLECHPESGPGKFLEFLRNDTLFRDVTFVLRGGNMIQAHRTILAMRSPVLRKMFTSNMIEGNSKSVDLLDVNPEAMQIFVNCLYDIPLPNIEPDILEELFWLSDKYQVDFLIPQLLRKVTHVPYDDVFQRMFEVFRKIRMLKCHFVKYKRYFVMGILRVPPNNRTQGMQDFLLGAQLSDEYKI